MNRLAQAKAAPVVAAVMVAATMLSIALDHTFEFLWFRDTPE